MLQNRMIYFKNQFHIIQKLNKQTSQFLVKQSMQLDSAIIFYKQ